MQFAGFRHKGLRQLRLILRYDEGTNAASEIDLIDYH